MKIIYLTEYPIIPHLGGIERVTSILAEELISRNHDVIFISTQAKGYGEVESEYTNSQYFLSGGEAEKIKEANKIIDDFNPDIIINQQLTPDALNILQKIHKEKIKIISVYHNIPFAFWGNERKIKKLTHRSNIKGKLIKYTGIVFPQIYRYQRFKELSNIITKFIEISDRFYLLSEKFIPRIVKLMPGINEQKLDAINNPNTFISKEINSEKDNILLFVGRLEDPQKNVTGFIDIWKKFHKNNPTWRAIIAGDGPHRHIFENYARKNKVTSLEFVGSQKDISALYSKSKLLCMSSIYEGWGMVLTEAMAHECVPAAFDSYESLHDIIKDGETGIICPAFKVDEMVEKLSKLAINEDLRKKIAKKGSKHISLFDKKKIADTWEKKIKDLLKERN